MRITRAISYILLAMCLTCASYADETSSPQDNEEGWLKNGKRIADTDNAKSADGFGVQMWIITNKAFFDDWNKPETPQLKTTTTAVRNEEAYIVFLFINPGRDESAKANVVADVIVKDPDGKIYGDFKDIEIWQRVDHTPPNHIQLAVQNLGFVIEDDELLGTYKVEAVVKDRIKQVTLKLQTAFTAVE